MSTASAYNLWKIKLMPTLKLHYDGWVALPAAVRQQLGLNSGDKLDVALVDGTIVLRLAAKATRPVQMWTRRRRSIPLPRMRLGMRHTRM